MPYKLDADAADELFEAALRYETRRKGLGLEFAQEMQRLMEEACEHPTRWPMFSARTRRHRSKRFPYSVVYQVGEEEIIVVAVAHGARRPGYWRKRTRREK